MFWRSRCYYDCSHYHPWRSFLRGMAAMLIMAVVVIGLLDYPQPHHARPHHATPGDSSTARLTPPPRRPPRHARSATRHHKFVDARLATVTQGLTWRNFHGIELPASALAGPRRTSHGLASGFSDTPRGALLAAVNIAVRTAALWGPAVFRPTITSQVTGRDARALLGADTRADPRLRAGTSKQSQPTAIEQAFRFLSYTPASASIDLVTSGPGPGGTPVLVMTTLQVIWHRGDWRLVAPPAGDWARATSPISSLAGYTIFSAGR